MKEDTKKLIFTVVAGGNGAGKSRIIKTIQDNDTVVVNADEIRANIEKSTTGLQETQIGKALIKEIDRLIDYAIDHKKNLILESNYRDWQLADVHTVKRLFEKQNYSTQIVYVSIPNILDSSKRVFLRVKKGGHNVPLDGIKINLTQSQRNFERFVKQYDSALLVDNNTSLKSPKFILSIQNKKLKQINPVPKWLEGTAKILKSGLHDVVKLNFEKISAVKNKL